MFEECPSVFYLNQWLEHLPERDRRDAAKRARHVALDCAEVATAASLLIELGDVAAAEARLIADADRLRGEHFSDLESLAKASASLPGKFFLTKPSTNGVCTRAGEMELQRMLCRR